MYGREKKSVSPSRKKTSCSPSLSGLWRLGDSFPSFPFLIFHRSPSPCFSLLLCVLDVLSSPMSHDDPQSEHMGPYPVTFTAPDTQATSSTIGNENGPFDPANTPPLIFAFIALGFTVFGLVIAIIYKRCRPLPSSLDPHYQRSVPVGRPAVQTPKLWDIWIPPNQHVPDEEQCKNADDWDTFVVRFLPLIFRHSSVAVDQLVDECPSRCQRRLCTLILPLLIFLRRPNTFKATLHRSSLRKTLSAGCSSDIRRQTRACMSLS